MPGETIIKNSFCTLLANHIVDSRKRTKSLNFLNLVKFGIPAYDKETKQFLKLKNKTDKKNRVHLINPEHLITYGALDGLTTYHQAQIVKTATKPSRKISLVL